MGVGGAFPSSVVSVELTETDEPGWLWARPGFPVCLPSACKGVYTAAVCVVVGDVDYGYCVRVGGYFDRRNVARHLLHLFGFDVSIE